MRRCSKCGNENSMEGRFCEKCGGEIVASGASGGGLKGSLSGPGRPSSTSSFEGSSTPPSVGSSGGSSLFTRPDGASSSGSSPMSSPTGSSLFSSPSYRSSSSSSSMGSPPMSSSSMGSPPIGTPPVSPPPLGSSPGSPLVGSPPVGHPPVGPPPTYLEKKIISMKRTMKITKVLAGAALLLIIVIAVIIFTREPEHASALTPEQIFEQNANAVFQVLGPGGRTGSAFFICSTGIAVTNHHVIYSMFQAVAILHDGRELNIIGFYSYDLDNDLAIIRVEGDGFAYTTLGDSDTLSAGAAVSVIGSPAVELGGVREAQHNTIQAGVVTTFIEEPLDFDGYSIPGLIQVSDYMIFGGNSGGPVFNDRGQVIGVSVAGRGAFFMLDSGGNIVLDTRHLGFAVPINRLDISDIQSRQLSALPLATNVSARLGDAPEHFPEHFYGVPNFLSVSNNAQYLNSGPAVEVGLDVYGYERVYQYRLPSEHFEADVSSYEMALYEQGFVWQDSFGYSIESGMWFYFYHPTEDISVSLYYFTPEELFVVAMGGGNIFENVHGGN